MSIVTLTIAFSNGQVRERCVEKGEAFQLLGRPDNHGMASYKIPHNDCELLTIAGAGGREYLVPSQVTIIVPAALPLHTPHPTRHGIFQRDMGECQYCGKKLTMETATLDHVIPRSRGGLDIWTNLVLACGRCNARKADRLPAEAGMTLRRQPFCPHNV